MSTWREGRSSWELLLGSCSNPWLSDLVMQHQEPIELRRRTGSGSRWPLLTGLREPPALADLICAVTQVDNIKTGPGVWTISKKPGHKREFVSISLFFKSWFRPSLSALIYPTSTVFRSDTGGQGEKGEASSAVAFIFSGDDVLKNGSSAV